MMRVRICTIRCRCQSSCRRSRFSPSATQIRGKRSSIRSRSSSSASWRSVFCLRTRLVRISAASPIHSSNCTSVSSRSNQRACPTGFHPNPHFFSAHLELAVELLRFLAVSQFPFVPLTRVRIDKRNLLEARVIVTTYNDHVRLLSPEPWLAPPKFTRAWEPTLLWNHYTHDRVLSVIACFRQLLFVFVDFRSEIC